MRTSLETDDLKKILKIARNQFAQVSICDKTNSWSSQYFQIDGVKDIETSNGVVSILIVHSCSTSACAAIDLRQVFGVRFNKYINADGALVNELVNVQSQSENPVSHRVKNRTSAT